MEVAIEYFSIFGGLDIKVNTTLSLEDSIQNLILDDYRYLRNIMTDLTSNDPLLLSILSGAALGDRRTNSSFRRAKVSFATGMECVEELCDMGVISLEKSLQHLTNQSGYSDVSKKILFKNPFVRFWFAFISPIFKGVRDGNYEEFYKEFQNRKSQFFELIFQELSMEFLKQQFKNEEISQVGRYWDEYIDIDMIIKTNSGKIIVANSKYTNSKLKKAELTKLQKDCETIDLKVDIFALFSKKGYSNELKSLKGDGLKLYTIKSLKALKQFRYNIIK